MSGCECAGTVAAVGRGTALRVGDRVMYWPGPGMQSYVVAEEKWCYPVPGDLSFAEAAALPLAYMTAYTALVYRGKLTAGESVLVLGATGGVGMAACHIAKALGAKVIAAGGSDEKLAVVSSEFGADHVVNYTTHPTFRTQVKSATPGKGVDLVFDPVSGSVLLEAFRCVRTNARVVIVGFAGAPVSEGVTGAPTQLILAKNLTVLGSGHDLFNRDCIRPGMAMVREMIEAGKFRPRVHASYPIERVREVIMCLWNRFVIGKVVVIMPEL